MHPPLAIFYTQRAWCCKMIYKTIASRAFKDLEIDDFELITCYILYIKK